MFELITHVLVEYWVVAFSGFIVFLMKRYYEKLLHKKREEDRRAMEKQEALMQKREEELFLMDCFQTSIRALLRDRIYQAYNHYTEMGYLPLYSRENVVEMHIEYVKLRGNGMVEKLIQTLMELPNYPPEKESD